MGMTAWEAARSAALALLGVAAILLLGEQLLWLLVAAGGVVILRWGAWVFRGCVQALREGTWL